MLSPETLDLLRERWIARMKMMSRAEPASAAAPGRRRIAPHAMQVTRLFHETVEAGRDQ